MATPVFVTQKIPHKGPDVALCVYPKCPNFRQGGLRCAGCKAVFYCNRTCQKAHWPNHKVDCKSIQAHQATSTTPPELDQRTPGPMNSILVRPGPLGLPTGKLSAKEKDNALKKAVRDKCTLFRLDARAGEGDWAKEMVEIRARKLMTSANEAAKFYDHKGTCDWYYYAYGDPRTEGDHLVKNELMQIVSGLELYGNIVLTKSGPSDLQRGRS